MCESRIVWFVVCGFLLVGVSGCHRKNIHVSLPTSTSGAETVLTDDERTGIASWYGDPYHGRRTSNGEIYNKFAMTAAHRTLPFDTMVRVNCLENGKSVKVRINDRGPFVKDRIVDLSYAAAREIDMIGPGSARVRLDVLEVTQNPFPLSIQAGSFREKKNAENLKKSLQKSHSPVVVKQYDSASGILYRVFAGEYSDETVAKAALKELRNRGYEGLIVRLDR
jgi:rare lipoprotein A